MSPHPHIRRRTFLSGIAGTVGLSLAFAGQTRAQSTSDPRNKLVVIIARGAMDGLSVTVPHADPAYVAHRGALAVAPPGESGGALELIEGFGLHPSLTGLQALHEAGQLRFAPAIAIPARIRSHFDAQDVLENGGEALRAANDGWLNRALAAGGSLKGLSIGAQTPLILRGEARTSSWAPGGDVGGDDRVASLLQDLYATDPLLGPSLASGLQTEAMAQASSDGTRLRRNDVSGLGQAVARLMQGEQGADVVALSLDGWDTHARQAPQLTARLALMDQVIGGLKTGLAEDWDRTVVVVATEFGRTVRVNGTNGTDHGTGSSLLLAGGALKPGGLIGDWPTLAESRLFEGRDLTPTMDVRSVFKGVLRDHLGIDRAALDGTVFPNSSAEAPTLDGLV